jgi:hypothetical protein
MVLKNKRDSVVSNKLRELHTRILNLHEGMIKLKPSNVICYIYTAINENN